MKNQIAFDETEIVTNRGVRIEIDPGIFSQQIVDSLRSNQYEMYEASMLDALIQRDEVILEVGAGCGFISTYCAMNPLVKSVSCFEGNPQLIETIRSTHRLNDVRVMVYNEILSKEEGTRDFFVHEDFWASGTMEWLGKKISVPATSFQRRIDEIHPTMIVVDIEGGELDLFDDVNLSGVNKVMMELHQPTIGRHGMKRLFDNMSKMNFHYDQHHSQYSVVTFSHIDRQ